MSGPIRERPRQTVGIHHNNPTSTREYAISDTPTRDQADVLARAYSPLIDTVNGISRLREHIDLREFGGGAWDALVRYSRDPNFIDVTFDMSPGTTKALTSKETVGAYDCVSGFSDGINLMGLVDGFPNHKRGIGYNGTHYDGVDVDVEKMEIIINKKFVGTTLNSDFLKTLYRANNTCNNAQFSLTWYNQEVTFGKGELRFRAPRLKMDSDGNLDISYNLVYSRSISEDDGFTIGASEAIVKEGHHYLWVYYEENTNAGRIVKQPIAVYIERLYEYSDFTLLQL